MFKTKICGVTSVENALEVAKSGVDAIGLNFFERSKRFVSRDVAKAISDALPRNVKRVGVFVNASSDDIEQAVDVAALDYVQLHGDEPPQFLAEIETPIIRAFRTEGDLEPIKEYLSKCEAAPAAVLLDAYDPNDYGGTGKTLQWPDLADRSKWLGELPMILAGGLTPENVAAAIQACQPQAVDTASGVEISNSPGVKDAERSRRFVEVANQSFAE